MIEALKQLGRFTDAELMAAVNAAKLVAFVTADMDPDQAASVLGQQPDQLPARIDTAGYSLGEDGTVVGLRPGETVDIKTPGRPNTAFEQFERAILREIGVALELPYELLIKHFDASYSASRAALEMAWQTFRRHRGWLAASLLTPVWHWFLTEAVARGALEAPGFLEDPTARAAWSGVDWLGPARVSLDPKNGVRRRPSGRDGRFQDHRPGDRRAHRRNIRGKATRSARASGRRASRPISRRRRPGPDRQGSSDIGESDDG